LFKFQVQGLMTGSAQPQLPIRDIRRIKILLPDLAAQKEIVNCIGSIDQKIELNQRMNETLEGMARAIFKSWFVDFDPVHAKAEGRTPDGMDDQTAALFPSTFTPDGLPDGWEEKPISEIGDVITGKTPSTKDEENYGGQIPFITIPDMHGKIYVLTCGKYLSNKGVATQKNKTLPPGSICVSCIATPGLTILTHEECQTNQQINAVVPFKEGLKNFRFWQIKEVSEEVISKGSGGSVFHNLNKSQFSNLKIIEPSFELAQAYETMVLPIMSKILENEKQNQTLAALRDTLLPKLMSGELRVDATAATSTEPLMEAVG
jgi:type I restriction enzyme S subunit